MISPIPIKRVQKRYKPRVARQSAPPLTLVSSSYDDTVTELFLVFDRAVDASGLVGSAIQVVDGSINSQTYLGTGPVVMLDDHTVRIELVSVGSASGPDVELSVASGNGIVAVDAGAAWAGVSGLVLPFS